jgi:hypothetical protein
VSQTSESTYLYSQNNRDLYHQVLEQFNDQSCVFSRNLLAFIESPHKEPGPFYSKHVNECSHCQKMAREFSEALNRVSSLIPDQSPPEGFSATIKPELKEVGRFWQKKQKAMAAQKSVMGPEFYAQALSDFFFKGLLSRTFLKGLGYASLSALVLYFLV